MMSDTFTTNAFPFAGWIGAWTRFQVFGLSTFHEITILTFYYLEFT